MKLKFVKIVEVENNKDLTRKVYGFTSPKEAVKFDVEENDRGSIVNNAIEDLWSYKYNYSASDVKENIDFEGQQISLESLPKGVK